MTKSIIINPFSEGTTHGITTLTNNLSTQLDDMDLTAVQCQVILSNLRDAVDALLAENNLACIVEVQSNGDVRDYVAFAEDDAVKCVDYFGLAVPVEGHAENTQNFGNQFEHLGYKLQLQRTYKDDIPEMPEGTKRFAYGYKGHSYATWKKLAEQYKLHAKQAESNAKNIYDNWLVSRGINPKSPAWTAKVSGIKVINV